MIEFLNLGDGDIALPARRVDTIAATGDFGSGASDLPSGE
jgi:hypothetical protein